VLVPVEYWAVVATFSQPLQTPNRHMLLCDSPIGHAHRCQDCQLIAPQPQVTCSYTHLRACAIGGPKELGYRKANIRMAFSAKAPAVAWPAAEAGRRDLPSSDFTTAFWFWRSQFRTRVLQKLGAAGGGGAGGRD
jgi:hypothetical protein